MHYTWFFSVNSVVIVNMSSRDYILTIYDMVITRHHFSVWIQPWQWLCHLETIFWQYMIWSSPGIIFRCEFSRDSDYVIRRLYFDNIWYGHHQASIFGVNSAMIVTMSSGDYILTIYDMVITRHQFLVLIQHDGNCVIQRLYFDNIWYGHHQASIFSLNSAMTVIMSSRDYILIIYVLPVWVITKICMPLWRQRAMEV